MNRLGLSGQAGAELWGLAMRGADPVAGCKARGASLSKGEGRAELGRVLCFADQRQPERGRERVVALAQSQLRTAGAMEGEDSEVGGEEVGGAWTGSQRRAGVPS